MSGENVYELSLELKKKFNYFRNDPKFKKFFLEKSKGGYLTKNDLISLYSHMVDISNNHQQGAIVSGSRIVKIWNSLDILTIRNLKLEEENKRLKSILNEITEQTKKYSEFT